MAAIVLGLAGWGSGDGSTVASTQALTESDFAANSSLRLTSGAVGVTFMEPKGLTASGDMPDTGGAGMDVMPLHIEVQTSTSYSLDPADGTLEKVQLVRSPGQELVFEINASTPSATVTLAPGDFDLLLYSSHEDLEPRTVFLQRAAGSVAGGCCGVAKGKKRLIKTGECAKCFLRSVDQNKAKLKTLI